jgi:hypothetical protein
MKTRMLIMSESFILMFCLVGRAELTSQRPGVGVGTDITNRPDVVRYRLMWEKRQNLMPYLNNILRNHHALSDICNSKLICVGKVLRVDKLGFSNQDNKSGVNDTAPESFTGEKKRLIVVVETNLQGSVGSKITVIVNYRDTESFYSQGQEWKEMEPGKRYLFFLSELTTDARTALPAYLVQWEALIPLDRDAEAMIATVLEAIPVFRQGPETDYDAYYNLLRSHCQSPLQRIREDANSALLKFFLYCPANILTRILADPVIHPLHKEYITDTIIQTRIGKMKNLKRDDVQSDTSEK